jgi:hypothetical protein
MGIGRGWRGRVGSCDGSRPRSESRAPSAMLTASSGGCGAGADLRADPPDDAVCDARSTRARRVDADRGGRRPKGASQKNFDTNLRLRFHGESRAFLPVCDGLSNRALQDRLREMIIIHRSPDARHPNADGPERVLIPRMCLVCRGFVPRKRGMKTWKDVIIMQTPTRTAMPHARPRTCGTAQRVVNTGFSCDPETASSVRGSGPNVTPSDALPRRSAL